MLAFFECFTVVEPRSESESFSTPVPESVADIASVKVPESTFGGIRLFGAHEVGKLVDKFPREADTFRMVFQQSSIMDKYLVFDGKQDTASVTLALPSWISELVVFGEADNGATLLLANPAIRTKDGEWETWLYDWRLGAYRFISAAELIGHLYHFEVRKISAAEYRFGREFAPKTCAAHLFSTGMDQEPASVPSG